VGGFLRGVFVFHPALWGRLCPRGSCGEYTKERDDCHAKHVPWRPGAGRRAAAAAERGESAVSYRRTVTVQRQAITKPTGTGGLGPLLNTAGPDKKKILTETAVRFAIVALVFAIQRKNGGGQLEAMDYALLVIYTGFFLWPLLHWRDTMEFHINGLRFKGEDYPFNGLREVTWRSWMAFGTTVRLDVGKETLNVTYVAEVKKLFNRCYTDLI
jgi:hypothetical protein